MLRNHKRTPNSSLTSKSEGTSDYLAFCDAPIRLVCQLLYDLSKINRQAKSVMGPLTEATEFPIHPSLQQGIQAACRSWRLTGRIQPGWSRFLRLGWRGRAGLELLPTHAGFVGPQDRFGLGGVLGIFQGQGKQAAHGITATQ